MKALALWIVSVLVGFGAICAVVTAVIAWKHTYPEWSAVFDLLGLVGILGSWAIGGLLYRRLTSPF